ncbi:hypothetical protein AB0C65_35845 [Nocardia sp. NPDC048505]|uniref:hypothetical protein n=1 Tax=Nocardia sp. NPDC048505 TaxID=3155756 RepID=UPI0033E1EB50
MSKRPEIDHRRRARRARSRVVVAVAPDCIRVEQHPQGPVPAVVSLRVVVPDHLTEDPGTKQVDGQPVLYMAWFPACQQCREQMHALLAVMPPELAGLLLEERPLALPDGTCEQGDEHRGGV